MSELLAKLSYAGEEVESLRALLVERDKQLAEARGHNSAGVDGTPHAIHPWYGSCDAIAPGGACSECLRIIEGLKEDVAWVEGIKEKVDYSEAERTHQQLWAGDEVKGGFAPDSVLCDIIWSKNWKELQKMWKEKEWAPEQKWNALSQMVAAAVDVPSDFARVAEQATMWQLQRDKFARELWRSTPAQGKRECRDYAKGGEDYHRLLISIVEPEGEEA